MRLKNFARVYGLLLGLLLASTAFLVTTQTGRQWVRHRVEALSAALLFNPQDKVTSPLSIGPSTTMFSVRSYGGKCLEFTPSNRLGGGFSIFSSSPVFINDCNGSAVQQIFVEELRDRPGHLVVLHAGSRVIGRGRNVNLTISDHPSSAPSNSSDSAAQDPLELQDYTGAEGQIFALDGDSIILAADRNLVAEVQNARGANKTPLVLGPRDLDDSEFWTFTATDGSSKRPTSGFVYVPQYSNPIEQTLAFVNAVHQANGNPGTVIEIDPNASIELSGDLPLYTSAGITIRGDRRGTRLGPELWTWREAHDGMLDIRDNDVRVTGLRVRGPSRQTEDNGLDARGIAVSGNALRLIIDHNDMSDWTTAAVFVSEDSPQECDNWDIARTPDVRVARNFIHHNQRQNAGYGVCTNVGGYPLVEGNTFVSNRHAIKAGGEAYTGYRAWYNLILSAAPLQQHLDGIINWHTQDFDVHGTGDNGFGGRGGWYFDIARNTFLGTNRENFDLRGEPCYLAEFHHNVSLQSFEDAIACSDCGGGVNKLKVSDNNHFSSANPTARLMVGDFDGDGKDDLFLATGSAWYYSSAGITEWRFLNAQTDGIDNLRLGDFDGDGRTDVFTLHGRDWVVSWGGISKWEKINESAAPITDFAIGDFNGDHHADVFYANGYEWLIAFGGSGPLTHFAFAPQRVADLQFGDFNGDGKTDVFGVVGDLWLVTYGGTGGWSTLRPKLTDSAAGLIVADFNGDGRADIVRSRVAHGPKMSGVVWEISLSGIGDWTAPSLTLTPRAAIGRFNNRPGVDTLLWDDNNHLLLSSWGAGTPVTQSNQDMR